MTADGFYKTVMEASGVTDRERAKRVTAAQRPEGSLAGSEGPRMNHRRLTWPRM